MAQASAKLQPENEVDNFADLDALSHSQIFGNMSQSLSQASSYYGGGEECDNLIKNYSSQAPEAQVTPDLSSENADPLASTQTSTATEESHTTVAASQTSLKTTDSKATVVASSSISGSSSSLGKRKASTSSGFEPSSPKRKPPFVMVRGPLKDECPEFQSRTHHDWRNPFVLSPPTLMVRMVEKLPYGAQFEFARLVSQNVLQYNDLNVQDITTILDECSTNASAAPQLVRLILKKREVADPQADDSDGKIVSVSDQELRARDPWPELDREEAALAANPYGAMGYNEGGQPTEWYGGQVQFRAVLHHAPLVPGKFILKLERPVIGPSSQLTRRFGSKHFIRVKLSKPAKNLSTQAYEWLRKPIVICGHVHRAFFAKDDNAFLVRTNEGWDGKIISPGPGSNERNMSFLDFVKWFNSLELNSTQPMAKWASRFGLGLSTSAPGFRLERSQIGFKEDLTNETGTNMTDGAGSLNRTLLRFVRHRYDWKERPSAIQVRVFGSKGLLVEDASDVTDKPAIRLTPSQQKIMYPDCEHDPSQLAVDILRKSHLKTSCRLSTEIIVNLAENGVGKQAFVQLLENSLKETIEPLLNWECEAALMKIWQIVERRGGVIASRRAREQPGLARVNGWSERDVEENRDEIDRGEQLDGAQSEHRSTAWWPDVISGCPSGLEETIMLLMDSGFSPKTCPVLRDKLKKLVQIYINRDTRGYRIEVPMSATGFIVPDWTGVLEEGEVFLKSSQRNLELPDGSVTDVLLGDVLLGRHPCKLPTDVRKWKAVDKPGLHNLVDVIVLSTKGTRRAADWLAGGDYDGDKAMIVWQPELVAPFKNAPDCYADEPAGVAECFEREIEHVSTFVKRIEGLSDLERIHALQHYLLGSIRVRSVVGQYSNCHEVATYNRGYDDVETRRLAFIFCLTIDGAKSGMTVKDEILKSDMAKYGVRSPAWKEWKEMKDLEDPCTRNEGRNPPPHPKRRQGAGKFIMDELRQEAESQARHWGREIDAVFNNVVDEEDAALSAPYREILEKTKGPGGHFYRTDLDLIETHVKKEYQEYLERVKRDRDDRTGGGYQSPRKSPRKGPSFTERPIEERQDILRAASRRFAISPNAATLHMTGDLVERVKASFAYHYDCHYKKGGPREGSRVVHCSRFPFNVAFRTLCDIKAKSTGNHKTLSWNFYENATVKPPRL
ncbi:hypothetical protein NMY22_g3700 [Coprinellus aureogranulatus]|nr:hypothetical protein NMY22_g3700 [Coprinellus aureogranulatus]